MNKTALITGASKGIGKELAFLFAENRCDLILTARSGDRLQLLKEQLESRYDISVYPLVKDLSRSGAAGELFQEVKEKGLDVDYLVNNAGFGDYGVFSDTQWECYDEMTTLNITSLTHLTQITVTVLCPGPTSTHFGEVSKMNASQLVKNVKIADAREVAELGFKAMMKGKPMVIHGAMNKLAPFGIRLLPRKWVTLLSAKIMRK